MVEQEVEIKVGKVYNLTVQSHLDGKKIIIHKGGTGSGKTEDIMIFLIFYIAFRIPNQIITVVSESRPHLEIGAIRILKKHILNSGWWQDNDFNGSYGRYVSPIGSIIEFFSADRIGKALGARRDWLYGNEINSLKVDVWDELARRSENVIGDFNPTSQFWLEDWLKDYDHSIVHFTNYLDNPMLPETEKERIETKAKRNDNFKRIHILGQYGQSEGVVFSNWEIGEFDNSLQYIFGQDYGFSNDPTTLVKVAVDEHNKKIYCDECFYKPGLSTDQIYELNKSFAGNSLIVGDSAEPRLISELKKKGLNMKEATKGQGSISAGILAIQDYTIVITERSVNMMKELRNYIWLDKGSKLVIDDYNHTLDSLRYAFAYLTMYKRKEVW